MRLGFETVVWGRRIDDLDHVLGVLAACGYAGVEFGQSHRDIYVRENGDTKPVGTMQRLKERLAAHGLELIGLVGGTLDERMAFCGDDRSTYLYLDSWSDAHAKALEANPPFTLALHPHWFMPLRKLHQAEEILAAVPSPHLQLIIDTAHATLAEDSPVAAIEKHLGRLASVHLKDWKPDFGRWSHRYAHGFCPPGEGIVALEKVVETLNRLNFSGWVIMEQDHVESSPEHTALTCAFWAAKGAGQYFPSLAPDASQVVALEKKCHRSWFQPTAQQIHEEGRMAQQLVLARARGPDVFYPLAVRLLRDAFGAEAIRLWSYNSYTDEFCLLAASLADHLPQQCKPLHKRTESLTRAVIDAPRVLVHDLLDPEVRSRFDDQVFLQSLKSHWIMTVPVFNSSSAHHVRYILNVFSERTLNLEHGVLPDAEERAAEHFAKLLSVWADYLTDEMCSEAAGATNHLCGEVKGGVIPFVNALMLHLQRLFQCESAVIFLVDESRTRLEPAGETEDRIVWDKNLRKNEHYYRKGEGLTGRTWQEREMLFSTHAPDTAGHEGKSFEKTSFERRELLTAPLARRGGDVLGVVRLHNKHPRNPGVASTAFTDDDATKLDAVIQAALPHLDLLITQRRQAFALTRLSHELQNPLVGILGAAGFLRERLKQRKITDLKVEFGADYLDDIVSYQALMSRLVNTANLFAATIDELKPQFERTDLATTVVIPVRNQLKALLKNYRLPDDRIYVPQFQGVIPWLYVDRSMFQQVFFNLFVNAIKYNAGPDSFRVDVKASVEGEEKNPTFYVIDVEDYGIGLDESEDVGLSMFLPGVRGTNVAQHRDVSGNGIGLAVVKSVIDVHCGTVEFSSSRNPTRVRIRLPAALRNSSPLLIRSQRS